MDNEDDIYKGWEIVSFGDTSILIDGPTGTRRRVTPGGVIDLENKITELEEKLEKANADFEVACSDLDELRRAHSGFLRKLKSSLEFKNWPSIDGIFLDGVAKIIDERIKEKRKKS